MSVRRGAARLTAALLLAGGSLLVGPSALAQDADPCAPAADGSVPEMCQGGMAPEPAPEPDPCAPDDSGVAPEMCQGGEAPEQEPAPTDPVNPCPPQPVEPGDGVIVDEGDQGIAVGEPDPGAPPSDVETDPAAEGEVKPEPAPDEPVSSEPAPDEPVTSQPTLDAPVLADPTVICAFGVPVSAPVDSAAGGGVSAAPEAAAPEAAPQPAAGNGAVAAGQLPRTGPKEQLAALAAAGLALLLAGAGAHAAGRRRAVVV